MYHKLKYVVFSTNQKVDCEWGAWTTWGACSKTCGIGEATKTRTKNTVEANGGSCSGAAIETANCMMSDPSCPSKYYCYDI